MEGDGKRIGGLVGRLIDDGKAYARAEADLAAARVAAEAGRAKKPILFGALAAALALVALVALVMTLVLAMAAFIGPLLGGLVVVVALVALAGLSAALAKSSWEMHPLAIASPRRSGTLQTPAPSSSRPPANCRPASPRGPWPATRGKMRR